MITLMYVKIMILEILNICISGKKIKQSLLIIRMRKKFGN